jgi:hypothetical protein
MNLSMTRSIEWLRVNGFIEPARDDKNQILLRNGEIVWVATRATNEAYSQDGPPRTTDAPKPTTQGQRRVDGSLPPARNRSDQGDVGGGGQRS